MANGFYKTPAPINEPVLSYGKGSTERKQLKAALEQARAAQTNIPMYIGSEKVFTEKKVAMRPPHDHKHVLGHFSKGDKTHVKKAIDAALAAKTDWACMAWEHRAAIFLKAADLIAGPYRMKLNAATMLGQSKNAFQAEIDAACEMIDFLRFNVHYMTEIYSQQPISGHGIWNRVEQRPLEGFVFAITPFNFTAIAGNLPSAPALMGNTVVWKAADTQIYAAGLLMEIFLEAGLPAGVINLIHVDGEDAGDVIFKHPEFAGLHFTGSTGVFQHLWKEIGLNLHQYRSFPRIVGETGGKDFIFVHPSANAEVVAVAFLRGAFEYQGQKCSAASRAYVPKSLWTSIKSKLNKDLKTLKIGGTENFENFINAVIDEKAFDKITGFIERARKSDTAQIIAGGTYDKSVGYFIHPTVIETTDPHFETMQQEVFGPVLTVYVYKDKEVDKTLELLDSTSIYALTGAIIAQDRSAISHALCKLKNAAGNVYINDKPTGAVVGQQPFGGGRKSGTNDKAGSMINLLRWVSPRTIKETFNPPKDYRYPFLDKD